MWRGATRYMFGKRGQRRVASFRMYFRLRTMVSLFSRQAAQATSRMTRARLWVDGEVFPRTIVLLRRAHHTVIIQTFIWKDDTIGRKMAEVLLEVADRGVKVFINKEAVGDVFELERDFLSTKRQREGVWHRFWNHPHIRISHQTHNDHSKVFIIDEHTMLVTGMNIADEYNERWHDYMVELKGGLGVARYLGNRDQAPSDAVRLVMNTENRKEMRRTVMSLVASARESIVLEQCYLSDAKVVGALAQRSREGIHVTVILPAEVDVHHHSNMQSMGRLLNEGSPQHVRVFLYPGIIHGKVMLVDRERAFVGSTNMMESSLDEMGETNVLISGRYSRAVVRLRDVLRADILKCRPLQGPPAFLWLRRILAWMNL
ncbi:MAG: phosphatidylserine/phosphatidylglycerophosphate/cardiolipin synthase family protein [Candidatus Peribacteraceae bacterium]|jgi:cardiolipin synthase